MPFTLEIRPAARREFDDACDWYSDESIDLRGRFVTAVGKTISSISNRPLTFPVVYGTKARRAVVEQFPFSIFFIIDDTKIVILSIFHDRRNPIIWRGRID
jgi:toxin ParE1/3/4